MSDNISRQAAMAYPLSWEHYDVEHGDRKFICGVESYREYIEHLPSVDNWIPCSERLPEEYDEYLCQYDDGAMIVGWLENAEWCKKCVAKEKIIAWMPLPEEYKEMGK